MSLLISFMKEYVLDCMDKTLAVQRIVPVTSEGETVTIMMSVLMV